MSIGDKVTQAPRPSEPRGQSHTGVAVRLVAFWVGTAIFLGLLYWPPLRGPVVAGPGVLLAVRVGLLLGLVGLRMTLPWSVKPRQGERVYDGHPEIEIVPRMTFFDNLLLLTLGLSFAAMTVIGYYGWDKLFGLSGAASDTLFIVILLVLGALWALLLARDVKAFSDFRKGPESKAARPPARG